jgi:ubiquinone/menaquinone biosynthesis C-methylase UbiE
LDNEITQGTLQCITCSQRYPIVRSIPRFAGSDHYVGSFSFQWKLNSHTQIDSYTGRNDTEKEFFLKTGFSPESLRGKKVLDVGCGSGRFSEVALKHTATLVGVDLSYAIDEAYENYHHFPNAHFVQADIQKLPFKDGAFDTIFSLGVLHHTTSTKTSFLCLPRLLKGGGEIAIWVYSKETLYPRLMHIFSDFYRIFTTRMPMKMLWYLSHICVPFLYVKKMPFMRAIIDIVLPMGNHPDWRWSVLDTFDWYSPKYQFKHTNKEVEGWFEQVGLSSITVLSCHISVKGIKQ